MNPDLEADTAELRRAASALTATAAEVTATTTGLPVAPHVPRWQAADAATLAAEAVRQQLTLIGADVAETARRVRSCAEAYEEADARAATRFRLTR